MSEKCGATIYVGACHFCCELERGHGGLHVETGEVTALMPYALTWQGSEEERQQAIMQELADQAQELNMGY
jgi:hypothetical protein